MAKQAKRLASKEAKVDNAKTSEGGVVFEDVDGSCSNAPSLQAND